MEAARLWPRRAKERRGEGERTSYVSSQGAARCRCNDRCAPPAPPWRVFFRVVTTQLLHDAGPRVFACAFVRRGAAGQPMWPHIPHHAPIRTSPSSWRSSHCIYAHRKHQARIYFAALLSSPEKLGSSLLQATWRLFPD